MQSFDFYTPTKFIMDKDADLLCGREVKRYSDKVLFVHYGDDFTYKSGLYDRVMGSLKEAGLTVFELSGVRPNPEAKLVYQGIEIVRAPTMTALGRHCGISVSAACAAIVR